MNIYTIYPKYIVHLKSKLNNLLSLFKEHFFIIMYILGMIAIFAYIVIPSKESKCKDLSKDYYNVFDMSVNNVYNKYVLIDGKCYIKIVKPVTQGYHTEYILDKWISESEAIRSMQKHLP